jgi:hypothetical protein
VKKSHQVGLFVGTANMRVDKSGTQKIRNMAEAS